MDSALGHFLHETARSIHAIGIPSTESYTRRRSSGTSSPKSASSASTPVADRSFSTVNSDETLPPHLPGKVKSGAFKPLPAHHADSPPCHLTHLEQAYLHLRASLPSYSCETEDNNDDLDELTDGIVSLGCCRGRSPAARLSQSGCSCKSLWLFVVGVMIVMVMGIWRRRMTACGNCDDSEEAYNCMRKLP